MKRDEFGNRMKFYEKQYAGQKFTPLLPIIVRLDGRNFSKLTKHLDRPFDSRLTDIMVTVTKHLVEETNALIGYTQSDEITLILYSDNWKSQVYFDGKIQKIVSVLASTASAVFNTIAPLNMFNKIATFDCRAFTVPNKSEATNELLWRVRDCVKNSIQSLGRSYFSHNQMHKKSTADIQDMLVLEKNVNWNDLPRCNKEGSFLVRETTIRKYTPDELHLLPEKHEARSDPDLMVERSDVVLCDWGVPFGKITNREGVIFDGEIGILDSPEGKYMPRRCF